VASEINTLDLTGLNPQDTDFARGFIRSIAFPAVTLEGEERWEELVVFENIELLGNDGQDASHMLAISEDIEKIIGSGILAARIC